MNYIQRKIIEKKGIGTNILNNILNNNHKVYLQVYKENINALNLYKKLGFKIKETTETRYFMQYENKEITFSSTSNNQPLYKGFYFPLF